LTSEDRGNGYRIGSFTGMDIIRVGGMKTGICNSRISRVNLRHGEGICRALIPCEKTRQTQKSTEQKMMERFVILFCKQCSEYIHIVCVKKKTKENNRKIQLMVHLILLLERSKKLENTA